MPGSGDNRGQHASEIEGIGNASPGGVGGAQVYERVSGLWSFRQNLVPLEDVLFGNYGRKVSIDGERIAALSDIGVHVFERENGVWQNTARAVSPGVTAEVTSIGQQALLGTT